MKPKPKPKGEFSVVSYTTRPEGASVYCHWAEGLSMILSKGRKTMELNGEEIQQIVRSLPRTIGGSY